MNKSGKLASHVLISNNARFPCRPSKFRCGLSRYLKRSVMESRFLPSSLLSGRIYNTVVSVMYMYYMRIMTQPATCLEIIIIGITDE